jgi:hypothetical protein
MLSEMSQNRRSKESFATTTESGSGAASAPKDLTQFLITTALSLLLGIVPNSENPDVARHYIEVFILLSIIQDPPHPHAVFPRELDDD